MHIRTFMYFFHLFILKLKARDFYIRGNKHMKQMKSMISGLTAFALIAASITPGYAQTSTTTTPASGAGQIINGITNITSQLSTTPQVFNQTPQQLAMDASIKSMQSEMDKCSLQAVVGSKDVQSAKGTLEAEFKKLLADKKDTAKARTEKRNTTKMKDQPNVKYSACLAKASCDEDCGAPPVAEEPFCSEDTAATAKSDFQAIGKYMDYLAAKKKCANKDLETLNKQKKIMDCQMAVLQKGVNDASKALQSVLQANAAQYGQMNQYMGELSDQGAQIDALIGEKGKLTTLQASLYENLNKMIENESKFKNDASDLEEQTKQNAAYLEATKAQKFGSCMFGGTASVGAVSCWRPDATYSKDAQGNQVANPKTNKNGCPVYVKGLCSPSQAARSAIEMSYLTSNGQAYQDADRCAQASAAASNFDNVMTDISSKLGTDMNNWTEIKAAYGSRIDSKAMNYLQNGASVCTTNAENWKRNAQNPAKAKMDKESQTYAQQKTKLDNMKNTLSASLDAGLTGLNKGYADVMAALNDQSVSLNRTQCSKDNPTKMQECYASIRTNLQGLLEGNASLTTATKTIKGGTMVPGFAVPCQGLNGCITSLQTVREKLVDQSRMANQAKQKYVADGNNQVQTQLQAFSGFLATTQASVLKQYDQMKAAFVAMGVNPPESLKTMEAEGLEQMDGPNGEKGPYKAPKSMAAAMSGLVQPGGLINFAELGMKDAFAEVQEKAKEAKTAQGEKIKEWKAIQGKYANLTKTCDTSHVGATNVSCDSCSNQLASCENSEKGAAFFEGENAGTLVSISEAMSSILQNQKQDNGELKQLMDSMKGMKGPNGACSLLKSKCMQCFSSHIKNGGGGDTKLSEENTAAQAR